MISSQNLILQTLEIILDNFQKQKMKGKLISSSEQKIKRSMTNLKGFETLNLSRGSKIHHKNYTQAANEFQISNQEQNEYDKRKSVTYAHLKTLKKPKNHKFHLSKQKKSNSVANLNNFISKGLHEKPTPGSPKKVNKQDLSRNNARIPRNSQTSKNLVKSMDIYDQKKQTYWQDNLRKPASHNSNKNVSKFYTGLKDFAQEDVISERDVSREESSNNSGNEKPSDHNSNREESKRLKVDSDISQASMKNYCSVKKELDTKFKFLFENSENEKSEFIESSADEESNLDTDSLISKINEQVKMTKEPSLPNI